ncbi:lysophospholipid acyltransferase family protein [Mesonia sp.]|uniref:lysophospholipid acyltransferase family protein n=1 Tax=Mesonia sp. TaxID=1960830 RepID=UPI00175CF879|nr:lysophospholipid acyltransferase family protein [Mesonia sp.]HIB36178.1 1-acyl-sn-glycerol-3-phosphate acyltransferase [Mesonia sp.]HIO27993.1 1-acyl-sn-glycerol-3-phosphate acyltransferase [Flavobacteriaceae bacterium]
MSFFRKILITLWRVWFYILIAVPIIIMFPFLLLFTSKEKYYPQFFFLARVWAKIILYGMGFYPIVKKLETPQKGKSYMFVANHTSMTDIMLMLSIVKNPFVFVGKKELAKFPVFGFFYKRTCILVDRGNVKSRQEVFQQAQRRLNQGVSICIFPEGGVPDDESVLLDTFKDGAFRLAIDHQIPIVPLVFFDNKKRFSYTFLSGSFGKMRAKILPFFSTENLDQTHKRELKENVRAAIYTELEQKETSA